MQAWNLLKTSSAHTNEYKQDGYVKTHTLYQCQHPGYDSVLELCKFMGRGQSIQGSLHDFLQLQ
jgi:hypothetical protein